MSNKKVLLNEKSNPLAMRGENGISGDGEDNKIKSPVI